MQNISLSVTYFLKDLFENFPDVHPALSPFSLCCLKFCDHHEFINFNQRPMNALVFHAKMMEIVLICLMVTDATAQQDSMEPIVKQVRQ